MFNYLCSLCLCFLIKKVYETAVGGQGSSDKRSRGTLLDDYWMMMMIQLSDNACGCFLGSLIQQCQSHIDLLPLHSFVFERFRI
jgi:hypothetical protein